MKQASRVTVPGALLFAIVGLAPTTGALAATVVPGHQMTTDTTWTLAGSPYIVTGTIDVQGQDGPDLVTTLTIEPGVEVRFNGGHSFLRVGRLSPGALIADGDALGGPAEIRFTSDRGAPAPGDWAGIDFGTHATAASVLRRVTIEYAGSGVYTRDWALLLNTPSVSFPIERLTIRDSGEYGLRVVAADLDVRDSSFTSNTNHDVRFANFANVAGTIQGSTIESFYYDGNGPAMTWSGNVFENWGARRSRAGVLAVGDLTEDNTFNHVPGAALEVWNGVISRDETWRREAGPLVIVGTIDVQDATVTPTLTIEPGVEANFWGTATELRVGYSAPGRLIADGDTDTGVNAIIFTSYAAPRAPGQWAGVRLLSGTAEGTLLRAVVIEYAGSGTYTLSWGIQIAVAASTSVLLDRVTVQSSGIYGVDLYSGIVDIRGCTIHANGNHDIRLRNSANISGTIQNTLMESIHYDGNGPTVTWSGNLFENWGATRSRVGVLAVGDLTEDNTFNHVSGAALDVWNGTISRDETWRRDAGPLVIVGTIDVQDATVTPTLTIEPGVEAHFWGGSTELRVGYNQPGRLIADGDAEGGPDPILFTSYASPKAPGQWAGIRFRWGTASGSRLRNAIVEYAGSGVYSLSWNIYANLPTGGSILLDRVKVRESGLHGIYVEKGTVEIQDSEIADNGLIGLYLLGTSQANVVASDFSANGDASILVTPGASLDMCGGRLAGSSYGADVVGQADLRAVNIEANAVFGVRNTGAWPVTATDAYWGAADGPTSDGNACNTATGNGDVVSCDVSFEPWATSAHVLTPEYCGAEACNDVDDDGDEVIDEGCDDDEDGWCDVTMRVVGTPTTCQFGPGDCDDNDGTTYPGATQLCDGVNQDCDDPEWPSVPADEVDDDADGYVECEPWEGATPGVLGGGDCNDTSGDGASVHPGVLEVCDLEDNDCDELTDYADGSLDTSTDTDGDSFPDCWEVYGIAQDVAGELTSCFPPLYCMLPLADPPYRANRLRPDVFVEVDHMEGHELRPGALSRVESAFGASRYVACDECESGISLHMVEFDGQEVPLQSPTWFGEHFAIKTGRVDYDFLRDDLPTEVCGNSQSHFGTPQDKLDTQRCPAIIKAKARVFRYVVIHDDVQGTLNGKIQHPTGMAVPPYAYPSGTTFGASCPSINGGRSSSDVMIANGSVVGQFASPVCRQFEKEPQCNSEIRDLQADVIAHELGHTLGLLHGGLDGTGCKPNYPSVMNYARSYNPSGFMALHPGQTSGEPVRLGSEIRFSYGTSNLLDESNLNESLPVDANLEPPDTFVLHSCTGANCVNSGSALMSEFNAAANWDNSGEDPFVPDPDLEPIDINNFADRCSIEAGPTGPLEDHNDWIRISRCIQPPILPGGSVVSSGLLDFDLIEADELTWQDYLDGALGSDDVDGDAHLNAEDTCPLEADPLQEDSDGDSSGDACDCAPSDGSAWAIPFEVGRLEFTSAVDLSWRAPAFSGAVLLGYDTLRSTNPADFSSPTFVETNDELDQVALDPDAPAAGQAYYYLIRARNGCPAGCGTIGVTSSGAPRVSPSCP